MIVSEIAKINGKEFKKQKSDSGFYLLRNAILYVEAVDPIDSDREYRETDVLIDNPENDDIEDRIDYVERKCCQNAANIDYIAMLKDVTPDGVSEKFETVRQHYEDKTWNIEKLKNAVVKGWITADEFKTITGINYMEV